MYEKDDQEEQEENKENKEYIWPILMLNVLYEVGGSQERDSRLSSSSPFRAREQVGGQGGLLILEGRHRSSGKIRQVVKFLSKM